MKSIILTIFYIIIIIFSILFSLAFWLNRSTGKIPITGVEFEVKKGENSYQIAKRLYNNGYIHSEKLFIIIVKLFNLEKRLKKGYFQLEPYSTTNDIIKTIYGNKFITVTFTIPEGSTLKQIKEILLKNNIVSEQDLNTFFSKPDYLSLINLDKYKSPEGFLSPDTYKFIKGVEPETIFKEMVKLFFIKLNNIYPEYKNLSSKEFYKKIILASIIEKEVKNPEEAPIVAAVFYNRLNKKMKLQSCATVQYILDKPKEQLFEKDLLIDNVYNTYLYDGLPPTPISNPGTNSLKAAFYPDKNDYLYFVVKDPSEGTHHFSKTYEEHLIAQKKYKKLKGF